MPPEDVNAANLCEFHAKEAHPSRPSRKAIAPGQLLIGGKWVNAEAGETMDVTDPTTEASITHVQKGSAVDTQKAIDAAYAAFEDGPWGRMRHEDRAKIMFRMADLMDERADDFAIREAMDMGMPYTDFRTIIMPHCSGLFRFFADQPRVTAQILTLVVADGKVVVAGRTPQEQAPPAPPAP